jgi:hypothetical protein
LWGRTAEQIPDIEKTIIHHKMEFEHTKIDGVLAGTGRRKSSVQREGGFGVGYHGVGTEMREFYYDGAFDSDGGVCVVVQEHGERRFFGDKAVKIFNIKTGRCCGLRLRTRN